MMSFTNNIVLRTKKTISTISYLSEAYLVHCLNKHIEKQNIVFWAYIKHKADEDLKKEHFHVYAEPAKTIDTVLFNQDFIEPVAGGLPLRALDWRFSKFDDWYMYCLHHPDYLAMKGHVRNYFYTDSDFWVSDMDEFDLRKSQIDYSAFVNLNRIVSYAVSQVPLHQAIQDGVIPLSKLSKYVNLYRSIKADSWSPPSSLDDKYKHKGE